MDEFAYLIKKNTNEGKVCNNYYAWVKYTCKCSNG